MNSFFNFIIERKDQIMELFFQHIYLTFMAILIAIIIGIPLGILIYRVKIIRQPVLGFVNLVQAVPSLALLGLLLPILGIGTKPAITMVVIYSLLPIIKNTYIGLDNVPPYVLEASKGIGLTDNQILTKVQLPLSLPVIMGGVRISAVTAVGLMTIAAFIGGGGLGYLVFSGVQTVDNNMILSGAIPACILALIIDFIVGKIEIIVSPKGVNSITKSQKSFAKKIVIIFLMVTLVASGVALFKKSTDKKVVVSSKNFSESILLGNMLSDLIEAHTDLKVDRRMNLGGTNVVFTAMENNEVDIYAEYVGTGMVNILKKQSTKDPQKDYDILKKEFYEKHNISLLEPLGFNNTYTLSVTKDLAKKHNLKTISDLEKISSNLIMSPTIEFANRQDGLKGLQETYTGLKFKEVLPVDGGLRYSAIDSEKCDVIDAFSTDGMLKAFDLEVLEDDKNFFPPYYAVPLINNKTLDKYPELENILNSLSGKLNDDIMRGLNYKIDNLKEAPESVSKEFLKGIGLI